MPFDLFITRGSFEELRGATPSLLARMFGKKERPKPLTSEELAGLVENAPAKQRNENLFWVFHPEDEDPWFAAELRDPGAVVLSTSYTHHRFVRNVIDMMEHGVTMANAVGAHLFEEVTGQEITSKNLDEFVDPDKKYLQLQMATWEGAIEKVTRQANAPLEFPLGETDLVSEYSVFHLKGAEGDLDRARAALEGLAGEIAQPGEEVLVLTTAGDDGHGLTKVLHRPDGKWQIWPVHGGAPFAECMSTTLAAAEKLAEALGGSLVFDGQPFDGELAQGVHQRAGGLGVELFLWLREQG